MTSLTTQERGLLWQNALANWPSVCTEYAKYRAPIGDFLLSFLEGFFADTYGESLKHVTDIIRKAKFSQKDIPFASYLIINAEKIEPLVREKLAFLAETKIMTIIEIERAKSDYLGYLMTGNSEDTKEVYAGVLNREVALIGKMLGELYKQRGLKNLVLELIAKAITSGDFAAKQFVVVTAIYLEKNYRKRFLPDVLDPNVPILAKPKRFIYFTTQILPEKFKKLKLGIFSGLLEFMNDVRPAYCMIE